MGVKTETIRDKDIRRYYLFLDHRGKGLTEMDVVLRSGAIRTRYVDNEEDFVEFCRMFNSKGTVCAGLNPRPVRFKGTGRRARDKDIKIVQKTLIDAEPKHVRGTDVALEAVEKIRPYVEALCEDFERRGFKRPVMNESGNGFHLILSFCATRVGPSTKQKIEALFREIRGVFEKITGGEHRVRLDPTYDLSRIAKVPGTLSCKGKDTGLWRLSRCDPRLYTGGFGGPDRALTSYVMNLAVGRETRSTPYRHSGKAWIDEALIKEIEDDHILGWLWTTNPRKLDGGEDRSVGDYIFVLNCLDKGINDDQVLCELLLRRPVGKGRSRFYDNYISKTVERAKTAYASQG